MLGKRGGGWRFKIMQHTIQAEGFGVRLRPVRMDDAPFIVWLRNLDHAKGRVGDSATDTASQEAWLKVYFDRQGDYYFIIETAGRIALGAYGIYDQEGSQRGVRPVGYPPGCAGSHSQRSVGLWHRF